VTKVCLCPLTCLVDMGCPRRTTHQELKRLAAELGESVGATVALTVRRLRQDQIGAQLHDVLTPTEVDWLDAELG